MQHTISQETEDASKKSAFHPVEHEKNLCGFLPPGCNKRDSGYSTDNSPATLSNMSRFTFEKEYPSDEQNSASKSTIDTVLSEEMENSTLDESNDLSEGSESSIFSYENMFNDTDDDISMEDKEVQELFQSNRQTKAVNLSPANTRRPSAPIPTPEEDHISNSRENANIFIPINFVNGTRMGARPRPTISRGTQTPSPHCQAIREVLRDRPHPYMARGTAYRRIRRGSEGEDYQAILEQGALPDIIPHLRDRSVSLPEVPIHASHAEEIGRSLRRISDDFHDLYSRSSWRNGLNAGNPTVGSFPGASRFDFHGWWESLREMLSPVGFLSPPPSPRRPDNRGHRH